MRNPGSQTYDTVQKLISLRKSFAFYRMPDEEEPILILEDGNGIVPLQDLGQLAGRKGGLIAPFRITERHPAVLIAADRILKGWKEIEETLESPDIFPKAGEKAAAAPQPKPMKSEEACKDAYRRTFETFIGKLQDDTFSKLVLSHGMTYPLPEDFTPLKTFVSACTRYPGMMVSFTYTPLTGIWIGSTPEIILSGSHGDWNTVALAGTMPVESLQKGLYWSAKNIAEQEYVGSYIRKAIDRFGTLKSEEGPETVQAGDIAHLKSRFSFRLNRPEDFSRMLDELHPTPAVCGVPKDKAYRFIGANEGYDRAYYSGIIGILDPEAITDLYVNLRCVSIQDRQITFYAGGGILKESEVEAEWEETQYKMNTLKQLVFQQNKK